MCHRRAEKQFAPRARRLGFMALAVLVCVCAGCPSVHIAQHDVGVIKQQAAGQPQPAWEYPPVSVLRDAKPYAGLSGLSRPEPVPDMMKELEPPLITSMTILSDGSLVCVSPLELKYDSVKFVFATYWRERVTKVRVLLLNDENGTVRWSQTLPAAGSHEVLEIDTALLLQSRSFTEEGKFAEATLTGLEKRTGAVLWQRTFTRPFRTFTVSLQHHLVVYSIADGRKQSLDAVDASTGKTRWSVPLQEPADKGTEGIVWPVIAGQDMILFDAGISSRSMQSGRITWERRDLLIEGTAQPELREGVLYAQSTKGLTAVDARSGRTLWSSDQIRTSITKLHLTGTSLAAIRSEEGWFSKSQTLLLVDRADGRLRWKYESDPILGNIVSDGSAVFFSTRNRLIALDLRTGSERFTTRLPWDDEFSPHVVTLRDRAVAIENEWNVALWRRDNGTLLYHHAFEPLSPVMTTKERMLEQKALGAKVTAQNASSLMNASYMPTASYEAKYQDSLSRYNSTGNSKYLSDASFYRQMERSSASIDMAISQQIALTQSVIAASVAVSSAKTQLAHGMVYPAIDAVIQRHRAFDTTDLAVRLVGVEISGQRFSALDILQMDTGTSRRVLLSPAQIPEDFTTIGSSRMSATELTGYLPAAVYLPHNYLYAVDFPRKRIYSYGAGLHADAYVRYGEGGFIRGRLRMIPLDLSGLER